MLGQRFIKSKRVTTSNWASDRLEPRQMRYAADDAYVALRVLYAIGLDDEAVQFALKSTT